ncbi:hypothetical protein XA68_16427 [Ophiocordyceps unilateralis]|uniref:Uncharacterized protein n=1 Tax=Ophiocordyceps unilateralis TaxID=268505 RepID=A0A2A9P6M0_OPHUN|nr:hypothetical protein XA68_16427 [Ophiocordyceps unilateralis]
MLLLSLFIVGASALGYQCSIDFETPKLLHVFKVLNECGTPSGTTNRNCFEGRMRRDSRYYASVGYQMAAWEEHTRMAFLSLRYMPHLNRVRGETWWECIMNVLRNGNRICWYVRDFSSDQHLDAFSNHLGSVFFVDSLFREPLMHVPGDVMKLDVRRGSHCFSPDDLFKEVRLRAIQALISQYRDERVGSPWLETYRSVNGKTSTDLALSAIFVRLLRHYKCPAKIKCTDELVPGAVYLPKSVKDFLGKLLDVIEKDEVFCFYDTPLKFPVQNWYYFTGFENRYSR